MPEDDEDLIGELPPKKPAKGKKTKAASVSTILPDGMNVDR